MLSLLKKAPFDLLQGMYECITENFTSCANFYLSAFTLFLRLLTGIKPETVGKKPHLIYDIMEHTMKLSYVCLQQGEIPHSWVKE